MLSRISSLSALIVAVVASLYFWLWDGRSALILMAIAIAIMLLWRHRANIQRLLAGTEPWIGKK